MDAIYNTSIFLAALIVMFGPIVLVVIIVWPRLLTKIITKSLSRKKIAGLGILTLVAAFLILVVVGAIFEPQSVKAERMAKENAETAQKAALQKKRQDELRPIKKEVSVKSKIGFKTIENDDSSLPKDEKETNIEGVDGERTKVYEVTYVKNIETGRKLISEKITKAPIDKIVRVGTYVAPAAPKINSTYTAPAQPAPSANNSAYYTNCTEARNAGAAPIYSGQPGYRSGLDRDNDGVACE